MKALLTILFLSISIPAFAQNTMKVDSFYTDLNGNIYKPGDTLQLGMGSGANRDFVFIYTNPMSIAGQVPLGAAYGGLRLSVKSIKTYTTKKLGSKTFLICGGGNIVNYYCDIAMALRTGEVDPPLKR